MAKYLKTIIAGRYRYTYTYSKVNRKDSQKARAEKEKSSSTAQKMVNDRMSRIQLTGILALNFCDVPGAMFVTVTFDEDHYPQERNRKKRRAVIEREAENYCKRMQYMAKKRGATFKRVWFIGFGDEGRYHIHVVVVGITWEDVIACWAERGNVDFHFLYGSKDKEWMQTREWYSKKTKGANPVQMAKYAMQNANERPLGKHPWHASRNCLRPAFSAAVLVPDDTSIDPPSDCELLDKRDISTIFSSCCYVEYIVPFHAAAPMKRKRRGCKSQN